MVKLYTSLSIKYIKEHKLRSFLSLLSIIFGISLIFSTSVISKSIIDSYKNMLDTIAGKSQITARSATGNFNDELYNKARNIKGIKAAVPSFHSFIRIINGQENINVYLVGIKPELDKEVRDFEMLKGAMPENLKESTITITNSLARRFNYKLGDKIKLLTVEGNKEYTLVGILKDKGSALANGGDLAVINLSQVQELYGLQNPYNLIEYTIKGASVETIIPEIKKAVNNQLLVERPNQRGEEAEQLLASVDFEVKAISFSAILVSVFLIFNTIMVSVQERRKEIGTLRALGLKRFQITKLFLLEACLIGILGTILGIGLGFIALGPMKVAFIGLFKYFIRVETLAMDVKLEHIFMSMAIGVGACLIGAIIPSWEGAKTSPIEAMKNNQSILGEKINWKSFSLGLGMTIISLLVNSRPVKSYSQIVFAYLLLIGVTLMIPAMIKMGSDLNAQIFTKIFGVFGRLASENLVKSTKRTAVTVASLMIGLTIVIGMGANVRSMEETVKYILEKGLVGDLMIRTAAGMVEQPSDVPVNAAFKNELLKVPGIKRVDIKKSATYFLSGEPIRIYATEGQLEKLRINQGDLPHIKESLATGTGVMVSETFALRQKVKLGEKLTLETPTGKRTFNIVGIYLEITSVKGAICFDYQQYSKFWRDKGADSFTVSLKEGYNIKEVRDEIVKKYGDKYHIIVQTNNEYREEGNKVINDSSKLVELLELMTMVVAFIGVFNTLIISVLERTRQIGILRALGAKRLDIKKMVLIESGLMGTFGAILGLATGSIFSFYVVQVNKYMNGMYLIYSYPTTLVILISILSVLISLVAGFYPASRAARMNIVSAIEYE